MRRLVFHGAFLLVEGSSDERLFSIFVHAAQCQIVVNYGNEQLLEVCDILDGSNFQGYLGIVDADFRHVSGTLLVRSDVTFTDWHDVECMMLRGEAFDRVVSQFASKKKLDTWVKAHGSDLRTHILKQIVNIGCLLWHSNDKGYALGFKELETKKFVDRNSLALHIENLVAHVKNKSSRQDLDAGSLIIGITEKQLSSEDLWQLSRGHDFVDLLGYAFKHAWASHESQTVSRDRLEQSLRLAFPATEFAATMLYASIVDWEHRNSPYVILAHERINRMIGVSNG